MQPIFRKFPVISGFSEPFLSETGCPLTAPTANSPPELSDCSPRDWQKPRILRRFSPQYPELSRYRHDAVTVFVTVSANENWNRYRQMALTVLNVKNARPKAKPYKLGDEKGLYLVVTPGGSKLWRFDYRFGGKRKTLAFGKWDDVELAQARERRDAARKKLAEDLDPGAPPPPQTAVVLNRFETVGRDWHASAKVAWTPRYAKLVLGRLEADIFPHLGRDDIDIIEPPRLLEVIRKIEARGALEMAKRVKNHCSEIFQYGIAEGKCRRDPATDIRRALMKARPKQHRAALPPFEFPAFLASLKTYDGDEITKLALRFTLLTMVRTQETRFAAWPEFEQLDGSEPLRRLSPARMKMSRISCRCPARRYKSSDG